MINTPVVLKYGVSLKGPTPLPLIEVMPANNQFFTLKLAPNSNCPILQNDRVNGPIRQGDQRHQLSNIENVLLDGDVGFQTGGDCVGFDWLESWDTNIRGCAVYHTRSHAYRFVSVNTLDLWRSHAILDINAEAGSHCLHIEDMADSDIGDGCQMGGSKGSVVYVTKRQAGINNRTWLCKLRDGFAFNSQTAHGMEVVDCDDSLGIQIYGWRLDQNAGYGLLMKNSPNNRVWGNVSALNGVGDFRYEQSPGTVHSDSNYGAVEVVA